MTRDDTTARVYGIARSVPGLDTMGDARRAYLRRFMAHLLAGSRRSPHGRGVYSRP